jgi:hypothetical protein
LEAVVHVSEIHHHDDVLAVLDGGALPEPVVLLHQAGLTQLLESDRDVYGRHAGDPSQLQEGAPLRPDALQKVSTPLHLERRLVKE